MFRRIQMFIYPSATVKTFLIMNGNHMPTFRTSISMILHEYKLMNAFFLNDFQIFDRTHSISVTGIFDLICLKLRTGSIDIQNNSLPLPSRALTGLYKDSLQRHIFYSLSGNRHILIKDSVCK